MSDLIHICAEVQYKSPEGNVHSDICMEAESDFSASVDKKSDGMSWREFLHANLDEWLDKSNGTGYFYVGDISNE